MFLKKLCNLLIEHYKANIFFQKKVPVGVLIRNRSSCRIIN